MIKVTDLMINDWVSINGSNYLVKDIKKKGVIKLYEDTQWGEHDIDFNTDSLEEFLQRIPLTEEILEKNGFKKWTWWKHHKDDTVTYAIGDGLHVEIEEQMINGKNEKIFNLVDNCNDSGDYGYESNYICDVNYVHELQHALKLCKIEKEIVL